MAVHTTHYKDARVHYPDLKQQPHTDTRPAHADPDSAGSPPGTKPGPKPQTTPRYREGGLIPQNPNSVPPPTPTRHRDALGRQTPTDHVPDQV